MDHRHEPAPQPHRTRSPDACRHRRPETNAIPARRPPPAIASEPERALAGRRAADHPAARNDLVPGRAHRMPGSPAQNSRLGAPPPDQHAPSAGAFKTHTASKSSPSRDTFTTLEAEMINHPNFDRAQAILDAVRHGDYAPAFDNAADDIVAENGPAPGPGTEPAARTTWRSCSWSSRRASGTRSAKTAAASTPMTAWPSP